MISAATDAVTDAVVDAVIDAATEDATDLGRSSWDARDAAGGGAKAPGASPRQACPEALVEGDAAAGSRTCAGSGQETQAETVGD